MTDPCPSRSQPSIEPVEFPALLARRVGEPVSLAASEIPPARRQVELRHAPRRSAILARQRAQKPPSAAAIGWLRRHEPNAVVHGSSVRRVGELGPTPPQDRSSWPRSRSSRGARNLHRTTARSLASMTRPRAPSSSRAKRSRGTSCPRPWSFWIPASRYHSHPFCFPVFLNHQRFCKTTSPSIRQKVVFTGLARGLRSPFMPEAVAARAGL